MVLYSLRQLQVWLGDCRAWHGTLRSTPSSAEGYCKRVRKLERGVSLFNVLSLHLSMIYRMRESCGGRPRSYSSQEGNDVGKQTAKVKSLILEVIRSIAPVTQNTSHSQTAHHSNFCTHNYTNLHFHLHSISPKHKYYKDKQSNGTNTPPRPPC